MSMKTLRLCACVLVLVGCSRTPEPSPTGEREDPVPARSEAVAPAAAPATAANTPASTDVQALTRVSDPSTVCMVNDQFMGSAQIPVQVDGKTYYGCCKMCEARLNKEPAARIGKDPVSQREVDKASAIIGKDATGKVLYFESEETFLAYAKH